MKLMRGGWQPYWRFERQSDGGLRITLDPAEFASPIRESLSIVLTEREWRGLEREMEPRKVKR